MASPPGVGGAPGRIASQSPNSGIPERPASTALPRPMDLDLFRERAARFQALARRNPEKYRRGLVALVALGYGYVLVIAGGLLAILAGLVFLLRSGVGVYAISKVLIAVAVLAFMVLRSMWVRLRPPPGVRVTAAEAPALFAMVEEVRAGLQALPVHHVQISDEANASMAQLPTLGIFGVHRNYLTLGLPFLGALSPDHVRAIVAHELAHLSAQHSRTGAWIERVATMWHTLRAQMEARGGLGSLLVLPFFRRYVPYFDAYVLALSRENEFEADALAASTLGPDGPRRMSEALVRIELLVRREDGDFWPAFEKLSVAHAAPPFGPYAARAQGVGATPDPMTDDERLRAALAVEGLAWDTHPTLRERMAALGVTEASAAMLTPPETGAADALLGPLAGRLAERFDREWVRLAEHDWANAHREAREARETLARMDAAAAEGTLRPEKAFEHAMLVADARGPAEALPLLAALVEREPENADARFHLGRLLLGERDAAGLAHLEAAVARNPSCTPSATDLALDFVAVHGPPEEAARLRERAARFHADAQRALEERANIPRDVAVAPHTLSRDDLRQLRRLLQGHPEVKQAYIVRRRLRTLEEIPCHLLVLDFGFWTSGDRANPVVAAVAAQAVVPNGDLYVAPAGLSGLGKKSKKIPAAKFYERF